LKLPVAAPAGDVKAREERELEVESAALMGGVLEGLGYLVVARYEKLRSIWRLAGLGPEHGEVLVQLDELPFCRAVELEGAPADIDAAAARLGRDKQEI
ncbi:MAG: adenylate cyclase, partial [Desulfovibrio sp.]|nr:adenylate cyclase [Desulfovibrio sp.]